MIINPVINDVGIVLVGSLNPAIFKPEWFEKYDILSADDTVKTKLKVIHPEITDFHNDWLKLQVTTTRFAANTSEQPYIKLLDFVVKTFKDNLGHTPITKLGINRNVHFSANTLDNRNCIGKILAPRAPWGKWGELFDASEKEKQGGMASLTMEIRQIDDREAGFARITVEPSSKVDAGIFVNINDHFELSDADESLGSEKIIELLINSFESSMARSEEIIDQLMGLV